MSTPRDPSECVSHDYLKSYLRYEKETGEFFLARDSGPVWKKGKKIGYKNNREYIEIVICGIKYLAHRLAWFYVNEKWPQEEIDHIDGNKKNNVFSNLREATSAQQNQNTKTRKDNTSGFTGVSWCEPRQGWWAHIVVNRTTYDLGVHSTKESAREAYLSAKSRLHTFNPVPNR